MTASAAAPSLPVRFRPRPVPLVPCAALSTAHVTTALLAALLRTAPERLGRLEAARSRRTFLLVGPAAELPWVDGIEYLGRDPEAPALLVPTAVRPDVPMALFERALLRRARGAPELGSVQRWAVSFTPRLLVPASGTRLLTVDSVRRYLVEHEAKDEPR